MCNIHPLTLEAENAKLKRMYAELELALENAAIRDLLSRKL